jgi:hypothetical protein
MYREEYEVCVRWPLTWELASWSKESGVRYLPAGKDVSTEDEESPLVGSVTRLRLVETVRDRTLVCV